MSDSKNKVVEFGGAYVENTNFVPEASDVHGTFNTSGVGASHDPATISPIFAIDRLTVAAQIKAALDPEDHSVSADKVIFATPTTFTPVDPDAEKAALLAKADAALADGPVIVGGPSALEREAAQEEKTKK